MTKQPKSSVLYLFRPEQEYTCDCCLFVQEPHTCKLFGAGFQIAPKTGGCNLFIHADDAQQEQQAALGIMTPEEAGYQDSAAGFTCGRCEYFQPKAEDCRQVDKGSEGDTPGKIVAGACCNRWEADPKRAKLDRAALMTALAGDQDGETMREYRERRRA
ncbi:MAG TPA: hypothetical protein VHI13_08830 [Candidatus Kapabacteria bacterium]|nr:hypothetical protein [Candidatus Kapabacteria bacterium]